MLVGEPSRSGRGIPRMTARDGDGSLAELPAQAVGCARVVKWQTRWLQVPVLARACGFKSRLAHITLILCHDRSRSPSLE